MAKKGNFVSTLIPFMWHSGQRKPPELPIEDETLYQMFLFVNLTGIVPGFYDHEEDQFCIVCERYDDTDDEKPAGVSFVENINNNLVWTYEPVDHVISWMLIPAPQLPNPHKKHKVDYRLN